MNIRLEDKVIVVLAFALIITLVVVLIQNHTIRSQQKLWERIQDDLKEHNDH